MSSDKDLIFGGVEYGSLTIDGITSIITIEEEPFSFNIYDLNNMSLRNEFAGYGDINLRIDNIYAVVSHGGVKNVFLDGKNVPFEEAKQILIGGGLVDDGIDSLLDNGYVVYVQKIYTAIRQRYVIVYMTLIDSETPFLQPYYGGLGNNEIEVVVGEYGSIPYYPLEDIKYTVNASGWFVRKPLSLKSAMLLRKTISEIEANPFLDLEYDPKNILSNYISLDEYRMFTKLGSSISNVNNLLMDIYSNYEGQARINELMKYGLTLLIPYSRMDLAYVLLQLERMIYTDENILKTILINTNNKVAGWT